MIMAGAEGKPIVRMATDNRGPLVRRMLRDRAGTIVIKFALLMPTLLLSIGGVIDYGIVTDQKSKLQSAADAGSIAAAKELGLSDFKSENVGAIVEAVVNRYMVENHDSPFGHGTIAVTAEVRSDPLEVDVTAIQTINTPLSDSLGLGLNEVTVRSVARVVGRPNICVLGLDPSANGTISLEQNAMVTGKNCAVFSNSDHTNSIKAKNSATLTASLICSRGGKSGGPGNFTPEPLTDCPSFDDPLADRPEPTAGSCIESDLVLSGSTMTLYPGTYCGGLSVTDTSKITLKPGTYIIKDGPLLVNSGSSLNGEGVGFYFTGANAFFEFAAASTIDLSAPEDGPMAGLLMFEGRTQPTTASHRIQSDNARRLIGTIYLSRGELRVDADSAVADQSAYTAIVARTMRLYGGPHLVLNTNYNLTPVPVPAGIKGADQPVSLVQ